MKTSNSAITHKDWHRKRKFNIFNSCVIRGSPPYIFSSIYVLLPSSRRCSSEHIVLSFFLISKSHFFYLLNADIERYCFNWSHSVTQSVWLPCTRDRPSPRPLSEKAQRYQDTETHFAGGIRTRSPSKLDATDLRLRLHGRCDRVKQMWLNRN